MSEIDIIRAWKDEDFRASLSAAEKAQLPTHPAGFIELTDDDMSSLTGGLVTEPTHTKTCKHCCPNSFDAGSIALAG